MTAYFVIAIVLALALLARWGFHTLEPKKMPKDMALNLLGVIMISMMLIISSGALFN